MKNAKTKQSGQEKKGGKRKLLFWGLGTVATGILSYFGFQYWQKNHVAGENGNNDAPEKAPVKTTKKDTAAPSQKPKPNSNQAKQKTANTNAQAGSGFPIKKGSKGDLVKNLQQSIIAKHGKSYLPKGADGIFGSELVNALKKLNLPATIDETTYNVLVQQKELNATELAKSLYAAADKKDFKRIADLLKSIKSVPDYTSVNSSFKNFFLRGVRQTLVNGILGTFKDDKQKDSLRMAFVAMGLKYDGKKWSLSGIADNQPLLITSKPTTVWKNPKTSVTVPANMVLGKEIAKRKKHTMFESEGSYFIVESSDVNYYKK